MNMNTVLNFMDKIYGDTKMLTIIYAVGAGLLFIFIILLIISIRKPDKSKVKIIEDDINKQDDTKEEVLEKQEEVDDKLVESEKEEKVETEKEDSIFEKTTIIPLDDINTDPKFDEEDNIEKALDNADNMKAVEEEKKEEINTVKLSTEIPDVDDYVDNVVKKTYEKNDQFSSVYVGDSSDTMKLDKIMENAEITDDVKVNLVPESKTEEKPEQELVNEDETKEEENFEERTESASDLIEDNSTSLDNLKNALEEKEETKEQDEKKEEKEKTAISAEDLKNKLNALKKDK